MICVVKIYQWLNVRPISNHCISSAENEVLRVRYSDRSLSVIRQSVRPSTIAYKTVCPSTNAYKTAARQQLLTKHLWNNWAKLNDFVGSFLVWPSTTIQQGIEQQQQNGRLTFLALKNISETTRLISMKLHRKLTCMRSTKIQQSIWLNSYNNYKMAKFLVWFKKSSPLKLPSQVAAQNIISLCIISYIIMIS